MRKREPDFQVAKELAENFANLFQIPVSLILSILSVESGFRSHLVNRSDRAMKRGGAWGLGQMTLATAKDLTDRFSAIANQYWPKFDGTGESLLDPQTNVALTAFYLARAYKMLNRDFYAAALSYHQGIGTVQKLQKDSRPWSDKLPPFGREYYARLVAVEPRFQAYA